MVRGLNRNQLKYIAIITMIIDHIGYFFISPSNPFYSICRFIGKLTAPIMCYFLVEGYCYTSSKTKYGIRLFVFSIISQFAFSFALRTFNLNMIFTLFLCFLVLLSYEKIRNKEIKWTVILCLVAFSNICDWGIFAPLWVLCFYILRGKVSTQVVSYYIITIVIIAIKYIIINNYNWATILRQIGLFLFIPVLYLYNGEKGNSNKFNKWFFYIFYPVHLFIIALIKFYFA